MVSYTTDAGAKPPEVPNVPTRTCPSRVCLADTAELEEQTPLRRRPDEGLFSYDLSASDWTDWFKFASSKEAKK